MEKARQKKSILKNFQRLETYGEDQNTEENEENADDFEEAFFGLESEITQDLKEKIRKSRREKGRGLMLSFYEFNQDRRVPRLIRAMKMGLKVALVSDAGTPCISDPGFKFIKEAQESGLVVEPLPGPCAVTTALSASGFPSDKFSFGGYLPKSGGEREDSLLEVRKSGKTTCFYENPSRLVRSLASIEEVFGPDHYVYVGLELTKLNEAHYRDRVEKVREHLQAASESTRLKGEVTLVIAPHTDDTVDME